MVCGERERNTGEEEVSVELRKEARGGGGQGGVGYFYRGEEDWKEEFEVWRVELGRWTENEKAGTSVILDKGTEEEMTESSSFSFYSPPRY